jgi:16S rRNA (guanine527-N7)-methyltransferase
MFKDFSNRYLEIIQGELSGLNLTRISESNEFYHKQVLDSILPFELDMVKNRLESYQVVVDIGFGGGFPLLPLALMMPNKMFVGLEARGKKVNAVKLIASRLGIKNISVHHLRSEQLLVDRATAITFKAVGTVTTCLDPLNISAPSLAILYKGPNYRQEENYCNPTAWNLVVEERVEVPGTDERVVLVYENVPRGTMSGANGESNVPRGTMSGANGESNVPRGTMGGANSESNVPRGTMSEANGESNVPRGTMSEVNSESNVPRGTMSGVNSESNVPRGTMSGVNSESNVPRGTIKKNNKKLVKLSELI